MPVKMSQMAILWSLPADASSRSSWEKARALMRWSCSEKRYIMAAPRKFHTKMSEFSPLWPEARTRPCGGQARHSQRERRRG